MYVCVYRAFYLEKVIEIEGKFNSEGQTFIRRIHKKGKSTGQTSDGTLLGQHQSILKVYNIQLLAKF